MNIHVVAIVHLYLGVSEHCRTPLPTGFALEHAGPLTAGVVVLKTLVEWRLSYKVKQREVCNW